MLLKNLHVFLTNFHGGLQAIGHKCRRKDQAVFLTPALARSSMTLSLKGVSHFLSNRLWKATRYAVLGMPKRSASSRVVA